MYTGHFSPQTSRVSEERKIQKRDKREERMKREEREKSILLFFVSLLFAHMSHIQHMPTEASLSAVEFLQ
jgi:hypothetical protein